MTWMHEEMFTCPALFYHSIIVTFSFLTSSGLMEAGFSMATKLSTWRRWFCMTSLH